MVARRRASARQFAQDPTLLTDKSIVIVAPDQGLRRSLAFALEVEGYSTKAYDSLWKAEAAPTAFCTIVDDEILKSEAQAVQSLRDMRSRIILLTDGMSALQACRDDHSDEADQRFRSAGDLEQHGCGRGLACPAKRGQNLQAASLRNVP